MQQMMVSTTMAEPSASVKVIANLGESERVISQWKVMSDGSLELPAWPMQRGTYFLEGRASDGRRVNIPVQTEACVSVPQLQFG